MAAELIPGTAPTLVDGVIWRHWSINANRREWRPDGYPPEVKASVSPEQYGGMMRVATAGGKQTRHHSLKKALAIATARLKKAHGEPTK